MKCQKRRGEWKDCVRVLFTFLSRDAVAKQESSYAQPHDQMMRVWVREDLSVLATREKGGAGRGRRKKKERGRGRMVIVATTVKPAK